MIRWYRVRKSWADSKTRKGAFKILDNAKKCADQNPGYKVFDADDNVVYEPKAAEAAEKVPFLVKVSISDLNIGKGPGTDYDRVQFCPQGVYTIVEVCPHNPMEQKYSFCNYSNPASVWRLCIYYICKIHG